MKYRLAVAILCAAQPAFADGGPDFFKVRNVKKGDSLHVRSEPTVNSLWIDGIEIDAPKFKNLGCLSGREIWAYLANDTLKPGSFKGQTWCKVEVPTSKQIGWVNAKFLREAE